MPAGNFTPDFIYDGELCDGEFHGHGTILFADGHVLSGEWRHGVLQPTWGQWIRRWCFPRRAWRVLEKGASFAYACCAHPVTVVLYVLFLAIGGLSIAIFAGAEYVFRGVSGPRLRRMKQSAWAIAAPVLLLVAYLLHGLVSLTANVESYAAERVRTSLEWMGLRTPSRRRSPPLRLLPALEHRREPTPPKKRARVVQPKGSKSRPPPKTGDPSPKRTRFEQEAEEARLEAARKRRERAEVERARRALEGGDAPTPRGPSHRATHRQREELVVGAAEHAHWVSEEGRHARHTHGEDTKEKMHKARLAREAKAATDAAREKERQDGAWAALRSGEFAPPRPEPEHQPPTAASLAALDGAGAPKAADDAASCFSMATSALPLRHTRHSEERGQERDLTLRQAKTAVKHGRVRPGHRPGTFVHEYRGVKAVTNADADALITHARRG